jgi:thioesterase domain-containing protein
VEQLAAVIRERQSLSFSSLVPIQPAGSKPPFFCVHGLGGHVLNLHGLGRSLGQDQPVYALQAAGLDGERAPQIRVSDMAADYIREIRSVQPVGPYYLGGYSFGGIIAAEMACQLSSEGDEVALLAFFDSGAISSWKIAPLHSSYHVLRFMKYVKERIHHWLHLDRAQKFTFPLAVFNRRAKRLVFEALYRTVEHAGRELPPARYDVEQAQKVAARRHRPKRYPGSAVLFRTDAARRAYPNHPTLGWQPVILGGLQVYDIPGDHRTLFLQPNVELLTEKLRAHLGHPATRELAG